MKQKNITVCHIISGDLWAGAEVMAFHLLSSLQKMSEMDVLAIVLNEGRLASELRNIGLEVHVFPENENSVFALYLKILKLIKVRSVNVIHTHRYKENILSFLVSMSNRKIKRIATQHGMPEFTNKRFSIHNFINKMNFYFLSHFFNKVVVVSYDMKKLLKPFYGFKDSSVQVIHNGIPLPQSSKISSEDSIFTIGSSGRLFPVKGFGLFIEIANILKSDSLFRFQLAGDGPEREELLQRVKNNGLEKVVTLLGHVEDTDSFYKTIDLYVNTSFHEGIPMTVLEAMSHGIPIVASRVGGIPEIIDNGNEGFLIDSRRPEKFAEKCRTLSENKSLYMKMAIAARAKIEQKFSSWTTASAYRNVYFN